MLLITPLPDAPDLYPDHRAPHVRYALPDTLAPLLNADGLPRFFLLRYGGDFAAQQGGLLQTTAALTRSDRADLLAAAPDGAQLVPPVVERPAVRLVLRALATATVIAAGAWQPVADADGDALTATLYLAPHDAQLLRVLIADAPADAPEALELEVRFDVAGLTPGLPWSVTVDGADLRAQLNALLPADAPATAAQIQMAFRSLPAALLSFRPQPGADGNLDDPAVAEQLRDGAARSALHAIFRRVADGYELHPALLPSAPDTPFGWSLADPTPGVLTRTLRWSVSALHAARGADDRFFPVVTSVSPLARANLHVVNTLPIGPAAIAQVVVELRYRNQMGSPTHETLTFDGRRSVEQRSVIFPAFGSGLQLAYRLTCFVARPNSFPLVWPPERDFVPADGLLVTIDRASARLRPLRLIAEAALWPAAAQITCRLSVAEQPLPEAITLTAAAPDARIVLTDVAPAAVIHASAEAHSADGSVLTLHDGPLHDDRLVLYGWQLEPTAPDTITLRLADTLASVVAFAAVELRSGDAAPADDDPLATLLTIEADRPRTWQLWRDTLLAPLRYTWRLHLVERRPDGTTQPLRQTDWQVASAAELTIDLPP